MFDRVSVVILNSIQNLTRYEPTARLSQPVPQPAASRLRARPEHNNATTLSRPPPSGDRTSQYRTNE